MGAVRSNSKQSYRGSCPQCSLWQRWVFWGLQNRVSVSSTALKSFPQVLPRLQSAWHWVTLGICAPFCSCRAERQLIGSEVMHFASVRGGDVWVTSKCSTKSFPTRYKKPGDEVTSGEGNSAGQLCPAPPYGPSCCLLAAAAWTSR